MPDEHRRRLWLAVIAVLVLGAVLPLIGISWGLPYVLHPDEPVDIRRVHAMLVRRTLEPPQFGYPSLFFYVQLARPCRARRDRRGSRLVQIGGGGPHARGANTGRRLYARLVGVCRRTIDDCRIERCARRSDDVARLVAESQAHGSRPGRTAGRGSSDLGPQRPARHTGHACHAHRDRGDRCRSRRRPQSQYAQLRARRRGRRTRDRIEVQRGDGVRRRSRGVRDRGRPARSGSVEARPGRACGGRRLRPDDTVLSLGLPQVLARRGASAPPLRPTTARAELAGNERALALELDRARSSSCCSARGGCGPIGSSC